MRKDLRQQAKSVRICLVAYGGTGFYYSNNNNISVEENKIYEAYFKAVSRIKIIF